MGDPAPEGEATPDVRVSAKGDEGEPPMPNPEEDLACRHNTESAFKDVVTPQGHGFEV